MKLPRRAFLYLAAGTAAVMTEWTDPLRRADIEMLLSLVRATNGVELDAVCDPG